MSRCLAVLALATAASAVQVQWTGIVNNQQWTTPNNWYPAKVPTQFDDVVIDDAEGKDAVIVLVAPAAVNSLTIGSKTANARLRVLSTLNVTTTIQVNRQGVMELNSGAATATAGLTNVAGRLEFMAGTLEGPVRVSGVAAFQGQGAKVFKNAKVSITNRSDMVAEGSLQFMGSSSVVGAGNIVATGNNFQCIVMDKSAGNSFVSGGFHWSQ